MTYEYMFILLLIIFVSETFVFCDAFLFLPHRASCIFVQIEQELSVVT